MSNSAKTGATAKRLYHYTQCGLDYVYLLNGFTYHETEYGKGVSFHNIEGLHRAIGKHITRCERQLDGKEFRFLRKELELTQKALAAYMGVSEQTIAHWEKNENAIQPTADRLIRLLYIERMSGNPHIEELLDTIAQMDDDNCHDGMLKFIAKDGWKLVKVG